MTMLNGLWNRVVAVILVTVLAALMGGTPALAQGMRVTVNGEGISDAQVTSRVRLFSIEGNNTGTQGAMRQLVDEMLMMQEARRLGISISGPQIEDAYQQVARNVRISKERLDELLAQAGANPQTLRDRLAASIAWNAVVESAVIPNVQISELELDQRAASQLSASMSFDYILKEVIFVAPGGQNASARTAQADRYRQSFSGCANAVQLSLAYSDAAVLDIGRRHATQMPDAIAQELAGLNVGGITRPRVTERGVSMYAVCEKTQANDLTFLKNEIRQQTGQQAMRAEADRYLADLRSRARIVFN